jgi:signal transduction histidine kinase
MKVIWPSEYFVLTRRVNIFFVDVVHEGFSIITDQEVYELILYNLLQNALKYNKAFDGDIVVTAEVKSSSNSLNFRKGEDKAFILET